MTLLDLSKIEAGRIELEFEKVPVHTLFDHVQAVFKSQMDMKEVTLTSELAGDLPKVRADANKITWVLTNLISNALRYVSKDGQIQSWRKGSGRMSTCPCVTMDRGFPRNINRRSFRNLFR